MIFELSILFEIISIKLILKKTKKNIVINMEKIYLLTIYRVSPIIFKLELERILSFINNKCIQCFNNNTLIKLKCGDNLCFNCFYNSKFQSCPFCKKKIDSNLLIFKLFHISEIYRFITHGIIKL